MLNDLERLDAIIATETWNFHRTGFTWANTIEGYGFWSNYQTEKSRDVDKTKPPIVSEDIITRLKRIRRAMLLGIEEYM